MASKSDFTSVISVASKQSLQEALLSCSQCWETSMRDKCYSTCDKPYLLFLAGKRTVKEKLNRCIETTSLKSKKAFDLCYQTGSKDIYSLSTFVNREGDYTASLQQ